MNYSNHVWKEISMEWNGNKHKRGAKYLDEEDTRQPGEVEEKNLPQEPPSNCLNSCPSCNSITYLNYPKQQVTTIQKPSV